MKEVKVGWRVEWERLITSTLFVPRGEKVIKVNSSAGQMHAQGLWGNFCRVFRNLAGNEDDISQCIESLTLGYSRFLNLPAESKPVL